MAQGQCLVSLSHVVEVAGLASPYLPLTERTFKERIQQAGTCPPEPGTQWPGVQTPPGKPKGRKGPAG